jgi:hypothetical protein
VSEVRRISKYWPLPWFTVVLISLFVSVVSCNSQSDSKSIPSAMHSEQPSAHDLRQSKPGHVLAGMKVVSIETTESHIIGMYENSRIAYSIEHQDGTNHGTAEVWYPSGTRMHEAHYYSGLLHGWVRTWSQDGILIYESFWVLGRETKHIPKSP